MLQGSAVPPVAYMIPCVRFVRVVRRCVYPSRSRNTRYGWLAKPCPTGTFTLQEAPSFAWRANDRIYTIGADEAALHVYLQKGDVTLGQDDDRHGAIALSPEHFRLADSKDILDRFDDESPKRWRTSLEALRDWRDTLEARIEQRDQTRAALRETVSQAEEETLTILRDALIDRLEQPNADASFDEKAAWASERLLIDTEMSGCRKTTRVSQAIESLQILLFALDTGQEMGRVSLKLADTDGVDAQSRQIHSYSAWKAATTKYLYPENHLYPTFRAPETTTPMFHKLAETMRDRSLTAADACRVANEYTNYLEDVTSLQVSASAWIEIAVGDVTNGCEKTPNGEARPVFCMFGKGKASGQIYWSRFDTERGEWNQGQTWATEGEFQQSFWQPLQTEHLGANPEIIGVQPYRGQLYLFLKIEEVMPAIFLLRVEPQTGQVSSQTKLRVPEGVSGFSAALIQRPEALQNLPPGLVITVPHDNGVVLFEGEDMVFQRNRMAYVHYENVLDSSGRGWLYGSWKRLLVFGRSNSRDLQPTVAAAIELDNDLYIFTGMHTDEAASLGSTNLAIIGPDSRAMEVAPAVLQNLDKISEYRNVKELSDLTAEHLQEKKRELSRLKRNINGGEAQLKRLINDFEALVRHFHGSASIDPEAVYNIIKNRSKKIDDLSDLVSDPAAESLRAALRVLPDEQVESKLGMSGREFIRTVVSVADQLREDYNDLPNLQQQVTQIEDRLNDLQNKANELIGKELVERYREWREGVTFVDGIVPGTACAAMYYHPESPTVGIFGLHLIYESVASSSGAKVGIFKAPENPDLNLRQIFDDGSWRSKLRHYDYPSVRDTKVKYVATCFNPNAGGGRRLIVYHAEGSSHYSGPILQAVASDLPLSTGQSWIVGPRVPSPPPGTKLKLPWKGIVDGVFPVGTWFHADLEREWLDNVIRHNHRSPFDGAFFLRSNVVYLWESYYFLPMQIGLQLCRAGQYEAGLEWFKRVYNYTLAPDQRKIFPRLRWEERYPDISNSTSGWGGRVFNPHVVAASRRAAYTQFTLFAIIRCLLNYGDEEFAQDTGASVQRARALYEMALDLLQTEELKKLRHPCATLTVDIKEKIYGYVGAEDDYDGIGRFFGESINHINQPEQLRKIKKALEELDLQGESRSERINRVRAAVQAIDAEGTTRPAVGKALENDATATKALSDQLLAQENIAGAASQIASQALSLDGVADERNRRARDLSWQTVSLSFCIPPNPVLQSLRQRSELNLEKIRSCRNIAGMKRELAPYAAPIGLKGSASSSISYAAARQANIQPTDYRYDTLIARAKELVNLAQKIEASLLSALVRRDKEAYSLLQARQDMGLAEAGVRLQTLRVRETQQRIVKAELQRERAYIQADRYEQWQRMGMNAYEKRMFKAYRKAAEKSQAAADWGVASSVVQGASSGAGLAAGLGASAAGPIGLAALGGAVVLGGLTLGQSRHRREAIEARRRAEAASVQASHARRMDRWRLQQQVAEQTRRIAAQQIDIIQAHLGVVEHQREISELELEHNQQTLEFLQDEQFTTAELFDWMADVLEGVYRYFLQQATSMAKLAEQQLSFERQEMPQQFIQSGYWRVNRKGQTEVSHDEETPDRRGLTGSARLLQDIP